MELPSTSSKTSASFLSLLSLTQYARSAIALGEDGRSSEEDDSVEREQVVADGKGAGIAKGIEGVQ